MKIEKKKLIIIFVLCHAVLFFLTMKISSIGDNDLAASIYFSACVILSSMFGWIRIKSEQIQIPLIVYLIITTMFFHFAVWMVV